VDAWDVTSATFLAKPVGLSGSSRGTVLVSEGSSWRKAQMKIREVSWSNYRRLPDGHIEVRHHLVLVGPNDSGKSSVLRALHLCLGMPSGQLGASIGIRDFTDPTLPLILSVVLDGIEDRDREVFPDEISAARTRPSSSRWKQRLIQPTSNRKQ
jgi:hypothetical protein